MKKREDTGEKSCQRCNRCLQRFLNCKVNVQRGYVIESSFPLKVNVRLSSIPNIGAHGSIKTFDFLAKLSVNLGYIQDSQFILHVVRKVKIYLLVEHIITL